MSIPTLRSAFLDPDWLSASEAWAGHIPFAFWIAEAARPNTLVELGTHSGNSYFAFCQSVQHNHLQTKCFAIDTWQGDAHAGFYGAEIYQTVCAHNEKHYQQFSRLLRMTFNDGLALFENGSIDLLHIDGLHTYDAVKHDFETWLPKLSSRGIVLFHDIAVRDRGFGVWRVWAELSKRYDHLEFSHSNGLGVLFVGEERTPEVLSLIEEWHSLGGREVILAVFEKLGNDVTKKVLSDRALIERDSQILLLKETICEQAMHIQNTRSSFSWKLATPLRVSEHLFIRLFKKLSRR